MELDSANSDTNKNVKPHDRTPRMESATAWFVYLTLQGKEKRLQQYSLCQDLYESSAMVIEWERLRSAFAVAFAVNKLEALEVCVGIIDVCRKKARAEMELDEKRGQQVLVRSQQLQLAVVALLERMLEQEEVEMFATTRGTEVLIEFVRVKAFMVLGTGRIQKMVMNRWTGRSEVTASKKTQYENVSDGLILIVAVVANLMLMPLFAIFPPSESWARNMWEEARRKAQQGEGIEGFFTYAEGGRFVDGKYFADATAFARKLEAYAGEAEGKIRKWFPLLQPAGKFLLVTFTNFMLALIVILGQGGPLALFWALACFIDELQAAVLTFEDWLAESINVFEIIAYAALVLGMGLGHHVEDITIYEVTHGWGEGNTAHGWVQHDGVAFILGGGSGILFLSQFLRLFLRDSTLGPLVNMMIRMIGDVGRWLLLFFPVHMFFTVWFYKMFEGNPEKSSFNDDEAEDNCYMIASNVKDLDFTHLCLILFEISIGREGIFECLHESKYPHLGPLVMDLYLLVVVVLLMNMLIAMMAKSFDTIWEQQTLNYQHLNVKIILDYESREAAPTPLNLLSLPYRILKFLYDAANNSMKTICEQRFTRSAVRDENMEEVESPKVLPYKIGKARVEEMCATIDDYVDENMANASAEDSWRKKFGRDLFEYSKRSEEKMSRVGDTTEARIEDVERKVERIGENVSRVMELLKTKRTDAESFDLEVNENPWL